jgi:hypothetical protein
MKTLSVDGSLWITYHEESTTQFCLNMVEKRSAEVRGRRLGFPAAIILLLPSVVTGYNPKNQMVLMPQAFRAWGRTAAKVVVAARATTDLNTEDGGDGSRDRRALRTSTTKPWSTKTPFVIHIPTKIPATTTSSTLPSDFEQ